MEKYLEVYYVIVKKYITGAQTEEEAFDLYRKIRILMREGGFLLRKWNSNNDELKEKILRSESELGGEAEPVKLSENKVLGVKWNSSDDNLIFGVKGVVGKALEYEGPITKRFMLKTTASH